MNLDIALMIGTTAGILIVLILLYYLQNVYHKTQMEKMVLNTQKLLDELDKIKNNQKNTRPIIWKKKQKN